MNATGFASMKVWRLMVFDVPPALGGLLARLKFRQTRKNRAHWWRVYDPATDKPLAEEARALLRAQGLKGKWFEVSPPIKRSAQEHEQDQQQIQAYLEAHGPTPCPPMYAHQRSAHTAWEERKLKKWRRRFKARSSAGRSLPESRS